MSHIRGEIMDNRLEYDSLIAKAVGNIVKDIEKEIIIKTKAICMSVLNYVPILKTEEDWQKVYEELAELGYKLKIEHYKK